MQLFTKKISQVNLVLFVAGFLTITGNFTFLEKTLLIYPLSENLFFFIFVYLLSSIIIAS